MASKIRNIELLESIFDFLMNYNPINGFKPVFKPEDDFTILDLKKEDNESLRLRKPHLFNKFI